MLETISEAIENYFAAWNADNASDRKIFLEKSFAHQGTYLDPHAGMQSGIDQMNALIEKFRAKFSHRLEQTSNLDTHHNVFRLSWRLNDKTIGMLSCGLFVGEMDTNGRIERLVVFVDK